MEERKELLKKLTLAFGPPGFEEEPRKIMFDYLKDYGEITYDKLGSIIVKKEGNSKTPKVMIAGHLDEIGFLVKSITKEGMLKIVPAGGWWEHTMLAQRVKIRTSKGDIIGVVGAKPPHELEAEERQKVVKMDTLHVDIGAYKDFDVKDKLGVRVGDPVVPDTDFVELNEKVYLSKAFDNRVGCAVVVEVIKELAKSNHPNTVFGVGTVQEELGLRGAGTSAEVIRPDVAFAIDVSLANDMSSGGFEKDERLGNGPAIIFMDRTMVANWRLRDFAIEIANDIKIPYHVTYVSGGYDTGRIHLLREGVPSLNIGIPSRYIHSHSSMIHRDDFDNAIKLIVEIICKLDENRVRTFLNM